MADTLQGDQTAPREPDGGASLAGVIQAPDGTQIVLSAAEMQEIADAKDAEDAKRQIIIQDLVEQLINKREIVVRSMRSIHQRWIDDDRQWDGDARLMNTKEFPSQSNGTANRPPTPHLTRSRCDLWESRGIDLIAPTSEAIWDLKPLAQEDAQPPPGMDVQTWQQQIQAIRADADSRAQKMKAVIQDQLAACNSSKALRKMIKDAMRRGTGLVMGPMNGTHVRRKYDPNVAAQAQYRQKLGLGPDPNAPPPVSVIIEESIVPEMREGDPWCFFPDMTSSADKAEFAFYLHLMSETQLWEFVEFPGVDREQVMEVMDEKPEYGEIETSIRDRNEHSGMVETLDNRHAVWRYTGIIDRKYLKALDLEADEGMVCADIWFCNQHILKSKLTMLSAVKDFRIPYYVFSPFPIDDTMFGGSIAYLCRDSQRTATSAWMIALHNLSVSAGPQTVLAKGKIQPADGKYDLRGPKVWYKTDDALDINQVFASIDIPNNAEQAFEGFNMAKQLMDEELNTAQWASPDTSEPAQSGIGWAMMSNARTILQRRVCATADDEVVAPFITRMVLWNLLYNDREDIKGDYDVQPLCQSVRMVKDIQNQQKLFVAQNMVGSPIFGSTFNPYDVCADILSGLDVQVDNWMKPKDQWTKEQAQAPQANPQMQLVAAKTHTEQMRAQTETLRQAQITHQMQNPEAPAATGDPAHDEMELQKHSISAQVELQGKNSDLAAAQADAEAKTTVAAMNLHAKQIGIAADLHKDAESNRMDLLKTGVDAHVKLATAASKFPVGQSAPSHEGQAFKAPTVPRIRK